MSKVCILSSVHHALDNRIFYREASSLRRLGHAVAVIAVHPRDEVVDGIRVVGLPGVPRWRRPLVWVLLYHQALAQRADVYHFHDPELLPLGALLRWQTGAKTVYDIHESTVDFIAIKSYIPRRLRGLVARVFAGLEQRLARQQSALVFADEQIAASFCAVNLPKATLFNFPALSFIEQARAARARAHRQADRAPMILHLGGHKIGRGVYTMLHAFAQVATDVPDARLYLVGPFSPPEFEREIRELAASLGIAHAVHIVGEVPFAQVGEYLAQADVGWIALEPVTKFLKNIPTKLFEYMAYGLPVVSSDLSPVAPFLASGETGFRVPPREASAHAEAILALLEQPDLAAQMGERGQALVQSRYNWAQMEQRLGELYAQLGHAPELPRALQSG